MKLKPIILYKIKTKGEMSYVNLIDSSLPQLKHRNMKRANTHDDPKQKEVQSEEENADDSKDKDDSNNKKGI